MQRGLFAMATAIVVIATGIARASPDVVIASGAKQSNLQHKGRMDYFAALIMTLMERDGSHGRTGVTPDEGHTGSAIEYFTWLSAKLDSIEAMPSSRVSLFLRNAS